MDLSNYKQLHFSSLNFSDYSILENHEAKTAVIPIMIVKRLVSLRICTAVTLKTIRLSSLYPN